MVDVQLDAYDARFSLRGLNALTTPLFAENTLLRVTGGDEAVTSLPRSFDQRSEVVITGAAPPRPGAKLICDADVRPRLTLAGEPSRAIRPRRL